MMDATRDRDLTRIAGEELQRELRAYASVRLSPDSSASLRMRTAVMERARSTTPARITAPRPGLQARFRLGVRRASFIALVALLAVGTGTVAGVAAMPGGPLYQARVWVEVALLPGGAARMDAQQALLGERIDEIAGAVDEGNDGAADAAANAYSQQVDQAISSAAKDRANLLKLRGTIVRQLAHFESIVKPNDKSAANLRRLIARTQASLDAIDAKLAALQAPAP